MKVLVTGGAGFIGSNVVRELLSHGYEVRVLDNLTSGYIENLKGLHVEFVEGDIRKLDTVSDACKGVDGVFHLAACVGRQKSIDNPQMDAEINVIGTVNVLEAMRKNNVPKIVYSSSASIYGELLTPTIDEDHPQNADSPYGVTKLAAEKMILAYTGIYDMTAVCLRYFNIYGINQRYDFYGNVIPNFAEKLKKGTPITIFGDGEQTRDFLNVKDVAKANFLAFKNGVKTDVYNLGSGNSVTVNYLAKIMIDFYKNGAIEYAPKRLADVLHCKADINKLSSVLGFKPTVDLEGGVKEYLEWFNKL